MRFLVRLLPPHGSGTKFLDSVRALARSVMVEARNPKWTSYGALEVDVFAKSKQDFALFLAAVEPVAKLEFSRDLNVTQPHLTKEEIVAEARMYFNRERYWECHEVLEGLWRNLEGEEKLYVQGLILVCAAFVHHQKGEEQVALGVLGRASKQLSYGTASYRGIEVERVKREVGRILDSKRFNVFSV
ncbi:MAG: DUF309 domain-containing protein [Nitrososphaerales archaeon]|nr:DUF309 domain-containing protein [Nitrososphaerales archaeon]